MLKYLAIEGNIGAGKTTLSKMLAREKQARTILEQFEDNSFLPKFYKDQSRYAFPLEMSFLASRFNQLKTQLSQSDLFNNPIIADYCLFKSLVFSKITLDEDEFHLYMKMFEIIDQQIAKPDLVVYLYRPVTGLLSNIHKRGRDYEREIQSAYLEKIHEGYMEYFRSHPKLPVLVIEIDRMDFESNETNYRILKEHIYQEHQPGVKIIRL